MLEKIRNIEIDTLSKIKDENLISRYNLQIEVNEKRDIKMLQNIYSYSKQYSYNKAVFICGAEHRKSIVQKIKDYQQIEQLKMNWILFENSAST
jgi:hypothetical protein